MEVLLDAFANLGKGGSEGEHSPELVLAAHFDPLQMVSILLATPGIPARRLDMPVLERAYPDVLVGRWDAEPLNSLDFGFVGDPFATRIEINEARAGASPCDTRHVGIVDVDEPLLCR